MNQLTNYRPHFAERLAIFADANVQRRYEIDVPFVPVPTEMIETFYDLYFPQNPDFIAQFSEEERSGLARLDFLLSAATGRFDETGVHSVDTLLKLPEWQKVMAEAKTLHEIFQKNPPNQAPEPTPTAVTPPAGQEARQP